MTTRFIDLLKSERITGFFTSLVSSLAAIHSSGEIGISSLIDTWIAVRELEEADGKRRVRELYVVKSRGMEHSTDVRRFILSADGIDLVPIGDDTVVTGAARGIPKLQKRRSR
jgi:circadian clock protein KaiC